MLEQLDPSERITLLGDPVVVEHQEWCCHINQLQELHDILSAVSLVHDDCYEFQDKTYHVGEDVSEHVSLHLGRVLQLVVQGRGPATLYVGLQDLYKVQLLFVQSNLWRQESLGHANKELLGLLTH